MKEQILIFGLGHIGGSIAKSLCKQGIRVYAEDLSKKTITYAIKNKILHGFESKEHFIHLTDLEIYNKLVKNN